MFIRILVLAGLLALTQVQQAYAADPLIRLPKPADLEKVTKGKIGKTAPKSEEAEREASASASAAGSVQAAASGAEASASALAAEAAAPSSAPHASASAAEPKAASSSATAVASSPATASVSATASAPSASASTASAPAAASASASVSASAAASAAKPSASAHVADGKVSPAVSAAVSKAAGTVPKPAAKSPRAAGDDELDAEEIAYKISTRLAEIRRQRANQYRSYSRKTSRAKKAKPEPVRHVHWSYEGEGEPARWGKLNPSYVLCEKGSRQSPIDIKDSFRVDLERIEFNYRPVRFSVIDNGHTVQVNLDAGNRIVVNGRAYELAQFHFHRPSEERVNGQGFPMVAHLVHKDAEGKLAVVALLINEGTVNDVIQSVWNNLPLEKNEPMVATSQIDLMNVLPFGREYFTYMGSLTTPPCSEGVLWIVMKDPIQMSPQQIAIFARLYPMNARPIQNTAGRMIKESN